MQYIDISEKRYIVIAQNTILECHHHSSECKKTFEGRSGILNI